MMCLACKYFKKKLSISCVLLKYPNPSKRYVVFTDASDQDATAVLTQEYTSQDRETREMPIAYLSP